MVTSVRVYVYTTNIKNFSSKCKTSIFCPLLQPALYFFAARGLWFVAWSERGSSRHAPRKLAGPSAGLVMDSAPKSTGDDEVEVAVEGSRAPGAVVTAPPITTPVEAPVDLAHLDTPTVEVGDGAGAGVSQQGPGRLATLVPTLGRMAIRAQKASVPYVTYAAMASQEAARYDYLFSAYLWQPGIIYTSRVTHARRRY